MLKYIIPTIILIPLTWLSKNSIIWINSTLHSLLISLTSLLLINQFGNNSLNFSLTFFSDSLSTPLLILTIWLLPLILIASQHHLSKESPARKKTFHLNTNPITTIPNHNIYRYRTNFLLYYIWSNTSPYTHHHHSMGKPNRTSKRRPLLLVLYPSGIPAPTSHTNSYSKHSRIPKLPNPSILGTTNTQLLIQCLHMTSMHDSLYSKNTAIRTSPLTT